MHDFPDGPEWRILLKSLYVYSATALEHEAIRIDARTGELDPGRTANTHLSQFVETKFPAMGDFETTVSYYNLRRKTCEVLRDARLILDETQNPVETRIAALKRARNEMIVIFAEHMRTQDTKEQVSSIFCVTSYLRRPN